MVNLKLTTIISGGQVGADIVGVLVAQRFGFKTGGYMPKGFITQLGTKPEWAERFHLTEHPSNKYPPRTFLNVKSSDGTLRLARDFDSSGEKCTLKAINQYNKPYYDVVMSDEIDENIINETIDWIKTNNLIILNIAGNSEKTAPGISKQCYKYLFKLFTKLTTT